MSVDREGDEAADGGVVVAPGDGVAGGVSVVKLSSRALSAARVVSRVKAAPGQ